jgi:hypothetical protein
MIEELTLELRSKVCLQHTFPCLIIDLMLSMQSVMEPTRLRMEDDEPNMTQFEAAIKLQNLFRGFLGRMRSPRLSTPVRSRASSRVTKQKVRLLTMPSLLTRPMVIRTCPSPLTCHLSLFVVAGG